MNKNEDEKIKASTSFVEYLILMILIEFRIKPQILQVEFLLSYFSNYRFDRREELIVAFGKVQQKTGIKFKLDNRESAALASVIFFVKDRKQLDKLFKEAQEKIDKHSAPISRFSVPSPYGGFSFLEKPSLKQAPFVCPLEIRKNKGVYIKQNSKLVVPYTANRFYYFLRGCIELAGVDGVIPTKLLYKYLIKHTKKFRFKVEKATADNQWLLLKNSYFNISEKWPDILKFIEKPSKSFSEFRWRVEMAS